MPTYDIDVIIHFVAQGIKADSEEEAVQNMFPDGWDGEMLGWSGEVIEEQ